MAREGADQSTSGLEVKGLGEERNEERGAPSGAPQSSHLTGSCELGHGIGQHLDLGLTGCR